MSDKKLPERWKASQKTLKAVQVAFDLEQHLAVFIRTEAAKAGLTPSDQIRKMMDLSYSPPKRPRLTVSLSEDDYAILGEKFKIDPSDKLAIRKKMVETLSKKATPSS